MTLLIALSTSGFACGGFFCNNTDPVEQTGEQIVFSLDASTGTVTTQVKVTYAGPSESFAWVVPVPGIPTLGVTSNALFDVLAAATQPVHTLTVRMDACSETDADTDADTDSDTSSSSSSYDTGIPTVQIVAEAEVGPYETVTLQAESSAALVDWLQANGYDVPDSIEAAIAPYVAQGQYLLALKLQKDQDVGDLQPIAMTYPGTVAAIPIQLTAVAAQPGMPLEVYVFGDHRAVPISYYHVVPNPFAYDWFGRTVDWQDTIGRAADEAGGHAFATDFSGPTASLAGTFYNGQYDASLALLPTLATPWDWWTEVTRVFPPTAELLAVMQRHIPVPTEVSDSGYTSSFWNCVPCWRDELAGLPFDPVAATADLDASLVQPLRDAEALVAAQPHLTRLTSSLDAAEMTVDPTFELNPDLPQAVDRFHSAELAYDCQGLAPWDAPRTFTVWPGAYTVPLPSATSLDDLGITEYEYLSELAAKSALVIEQLSTSGQGTVIADERQWLADEVAELNAGGGVGLIAPASAGSAEDCGCRSAPTAPLAPLLVGFALLRRRRAR